MDRDKLVLRLFQVVAKDLKHKHYAHVVAKHKLYMQLVAGVGLDDLLQQYVRRESKELFEQRKQITQHIVTSVSANLLDVFYKIPRSNAARRIVTYKSEEGNAENLESKVKALEDILKSYWGTESFDDYISTRFVELNSTDPNCFVVTEWDKFDANIETAKPRPYEVSSVAAIDYLKINNVLQYLIVEDKHWFKTDESKLSETNEEKLDPNNNLTEGKKFTLYGQNQTFQLLQVSEKLSMFGPSDDDGTVVQLGKEFFVKLGKEFYQFIEYKAHNFGTVLAFQPGYYRDLATNGETYVNPLHKVEPYLLKSIKTNSELDLVAALLALPQQLAYGPGCKDERCSDGWYDNSTICGTCDGTGMQPTAPSAQDAIKLKMPKNKDNMIPLTDLIAYVRPPVDIVEWQEGYIDKITFNCRHIMFNSDVFSRKEIADTATGKNLDMQNVYDTLYPFAIKLSKVFIFGVTIISKITTKNKNLVVNYTFGKDFKLKTLDSLISNLATVNDLGTPSLVKHINADIANIMFAEQPLELARFKLKEMHNPFEGKSEKAIMLLMVSPHVTRAVKVFYANQGNIFDALETDYLKQNKDFYKLKRSEQRTAIYEKVDEIIAVLDKENPEPILELD